MAEPVRITCPDVFPPFTELKNGRAEGLAVEIVRAAAGHAGIDVEFVAVPFEQVQRTLKDGRAEAVFPPFPSLPIVVRYSTSAIPF
ncbi:transporter substrate-binding domain-containing protein [Bradyrhizobium elkanii]|uniref:transporter substrate-binding domain-containing protein n=1 Tax=Bradyrhizobium elkanii TaxID=29448 RepID=UPI001BA82748|nr:transporter substrate-binding domain-containing protein [Bradyrhizobium elkanii]MBR1162035.1 transporter substrate-binding domain-containing protein [Bradyrhizobium elkanii]